MPSSPPTASQDTKPDESKPEPELQSLEPGQLPEQIEKMLSDITEQVNDFQDHPPSTIQRLAELILRPRAHYKGLAPYLHAVDRVVTVTSSASLYPLATAPDPNIDPAEAISWANPAPNAPGGSDEEALGGAILTPIPWVKQHQPAATPSSQESNEQAQGAQIHSESTETIDGPNGMGRIETVSVSVNGIHSTGHARGITQGELLRQEQKAGVVPMSQLHRPQQQRLSEDMDITEEMAAQKPEDGDEGEKEEKDKEEEEHPHARGPEEIGVGDTGLQSQSTSYIGEGGLDAQGIDVEAAVGRKHEEEDEKVEVRSPDSDASGVKREAEDSDVEPPAKKPKEDDEDVEDADKMDTDKEVS